LCIIGRQGDDSGANEGVDEGEEDDGGSNDAEDDALFLVDDQDE
jgi:hypothetical protein